MVLILVVILTIIIFLYVQNNWIYVNSINIEVEEFNLNNIYKIVHLSDLHNKLFGKKQKRLINKIKKLEPNIIVFTGDIVDSYTLNKEPAIILMEELIKIAKVYYVTGNHEIRTNTYDELKEKFRNIGVVVLDDEIQSLNIGNNKVDLIGIKDYINSYSTELKLNKIIKNTNNYKILLVHRPERINIYSNHNINLVFSGHAHGGQVRIPFIGGVIAPSQGLFPKYTEGMNEVNNTKLVISRGLGNSAFPFRILNRPEIVSVTIKNK
ncbi:metallophosphoesterase [Clostridium sp. Ade.TY]|uniref:metallophosphoesterase n=1 Tax=Clostridium sp. Ade.TY TaxID=1391647 RepID=UPI000429D5E2|nr:metallophosphoesterase [Clostridium sp. Ade.TY]